MASPDKGKPLENEWYTTPETAKLPLTASPASTRMNSMSTVKRLSSGNFQLRVTSKLLDKPLYATFDSEEQAQTYGRHLDALLAQGIVPAALREPGEIKLNWTGARCIAEYQRANALPLSEEKLLGTIRPQLLLQSTSNFN